MDKHQQGHGQQIHYLSTIRGVLGMLRDPEHTESVFDIEDGLRDLEATQLAVDYLDSIPSVRAMAEERYLREVPDVDQLASLRPGTLGHCYALHLRAHGFDPDYYRKVDVESDRDYYAMRVRQTHDIWHVVTGFDPSAIGELALKSVEIAQLRRPMAAVIVAGGILRYLVKDPHDLQAMLEAVDRGFRIGSEAQPLLAEKWEEQWDEPLDSIRTRLNVNAADYDPEANAPA
ncbi:MAG: hypothetical protein KDC95_05170 [Planctomycetes bacterium]|nr:hypothetical protein [Planctomycetota bacterium]